MIHRSIFAEGFACGPEGAADEGVVWRAWAFHRTGVLVTKEGEEADDLGPGVTSCRSFFVEFDDKTETSPLFFILTEEQRKKVGMSDGIYHELNLSLARDYDSLRRKRPRA